MDASQNLHCVRNGRCTGGRLDDIETDSGQIETVEHPRAYVFASALGLPLGTYLGYQLTGKDEYTTGRARLIILGAVIGALSGSGVLLLADVDWENTKLYVLANMVGSAAGIWYTHRFTRGWGEELHIRGHRSACDR